MRAQRHAAPTRFESRSAVIREVMPGIGRAKALFLLAAGLSFLMSVYLFFSGDHERGIFVGIWVPSVLSAGALLLGRDGHD
ncbi:MAG TPA: hypothetical protein VIY27_14060 [Myxococcota bacterium]